MYSEKYLKEWHHYHRYSHLRQDKSCIKCGKEEKIKYIIKQNITWKMCTAVL